MTVALLLVRARRSQRNSATVIGRRYKEIAGDAAGAQFPLRDQYTARSKVRHFSIKSALDFHLCSFTFAEFLEMDFPKVELETLWCPWRVEYFEKEDRNPDFLSDAARANDDAEHLVVTRRKNAFLMMNRYPYAVGHLMAVPYRKVAELDSLGENEVTELWKLVTHAQKLLRTVVKAQGFNIGLNLGECAGAGVPDHLHIHIVPRWNGDTNFMPILSGMRLFSEALRALYDKLIAAQGKLAD